MRRLTKIATLLFFSIQTIHAQNIPTFFTTKSNHVYGIYVCPPFKKDSETIFKECCFDIPHFLQKASLEKATAVIIVPESIDGLSPVDTNAPWIEGARIGLAWASAYHRFESLGKLDIKIITYSPHDTYDSIMQALEHCGSLPCLQPTPCSSFKLSDHKKSVLSLDPYIIEQKQFQVKHFASHGKDRKTIVITGVAGFLGSHLAKRFLDDNIHVIGFDNFACSTGENLEILTQYPHFQFHECDVSQPYDIEGNIDYIAHLASIPSPVDYYKRPVETIRSGLHGADQALALASRKKARILLASSSEVYGDPLIHPQTEIYPGNVDPTGMRSQYDESKRGEETLAKLYFDTYGIDVRIARIFNTFGPGMRLDDGRVVTNFIKAMLHNQPMIIYGDGNQTRSPAYVSDTIEALFQMIKSESFTDFKTIQQRICNVGMPEEYSIREIADVANSVAKKYLGKTIPTKNIQQFDPTDPKKRKPDISYLKTLINFTPSIDFKDGFTETFLFFAGKKS